MASLYGCISYYISSMFLYMMYSIKLIFIHNSKFYVRHIVVHKTQFVLCKILLCPPLISTTTRDSQFFGEEKIMQLKLFAKNYE